MFYIKCPLCGANLDRGEKCDCENEHKKIKPAKNTKADFIRWKNLNVNGQRL